ncbi:hypothetical protein CFOL_v3_17910 [Cephalotus follicularis]|uniref:Uncharacterized protein n=1 Tax=Cephalotus follicularis TaxID=3775 RepID=A0A1Q3C2F3_CEPFO|nr:hypothetical protein CFOL_v3_17910 [Cephalotus follicularis]
MTNIENQKFITLDIFGKNYLSWVLDVKLHLSAKKLRHTIDEENAESNEERATALTLLRHHIDDSLCNNRNFQSMYIVQSMNKIYIKLRLNVQLSCELWLLNCCY